MRVIAGSAGSFAGRLPGTHEVSVLPAPFVVAISGWYSWVMLPVLKRPSSGRSCTDETPSSPAAEST